MKILLINDNHCATGGAENYFFELKARLKQTPGLDVYSIGFGDTVQSGTDFYVFKGVRSNAKKLLWRLVPNIALYYQLKALIKKVDPDVIHIHNIKQYTATVLKAIASYPVVQTVHDFSLICPTAQNIHRDLRPCATGMRYGCVWQHRVKFNPASYLLMNLAWLSTNYKLKNIVRDFIAPSPLLTDYLEKNGFKPAHYIPPFKTVMHAKIHDTPDSTRFLFAGSLATHKGIQLLLEEFALALKSNPDLKLDIAGTGPLEKSLQDHVIAHHLTASVRFLGWQKDLTTYYQQAIALIFPSIGLESFGLVVSEAMSHGRPIIGVNRGTTAWMVKDKQTGLLFDPLKKGDLAEKILTLAGNTAFAMQLGARGQQRISELIDNEAALEKIVEVYSQAVGKERR